MNAGVTRLNNLHHLGMAGQHDDRHKWIGTITTCTHKLYEVQSVQRGHIPVADDNVGWKMAKFLERIRAIACFMTVFRAERMQYRLDQRTHMLVVVNDQKIKTFEIVTFAVQNESLVQLFRGMHLE